MYLSIRNINKSGVFDYKGLDINQFVAGSQGYLYPNCNSCVVKTTQEVFAPHDDIAVLAEVEYLQAKAQYDTTNVVEPPVQSPSLEERLFAMESTQAETQGAVDFIIMNF